MLKKILFIFLLFPSIIWSQKDSLFNGKIVSETNFLDEVNVINVTKKIGVVTQKGGYFTIKANVNDTLMFSAINLKGYQRIVTSVDFTKDLVFIPMEVLVNQLSEITLTEYRSINAVSLGIIPKGQKSYTPAERKLRTAEQFKWYSPLLIPVGGMSVDGLVNAISGRTNMLKKELVVERKELLQERTADYFTKDYITNTLKIPEDYVEGFLFYVVEDIRYTNAMKSDNKTMAAFILSELASEYLELKKTETTKIDEKK